MADEVRVDGREKLISFGQYPDVPLKAAHERRDEARRLIAARVDPSEERKAERSLISDTFEAIAREYLQLKSKGLSARTYDKKLGRFEAFAFPFIGKLPITLIGAPQLLAACAESKIAESTRPLTVYTRTAEKCSGTPSQPAAPGAIRLLTFGAQSRPSSFATIPPLPSRPRSVSCCEP